MKCHRAEQLILLQDSGELGAWGRRRLARHVAGCTHCREYATSLLALTEAVRAWPAGSPAESTLAAIRNAAPAAPDRREAIVLGPARRPVWQTALAYAALTVVLVAAGLWLALPRHRATSVAAVAQVEKTATPSADAATAWDDNLDQELDAINDVLASALDDKNGNSATSATSDDTDADTIARELLTLQGYTI